MNNIYEGKYMRRKKPVYKIIAGLIQAYHSSVNAGKKEWIDRHEETLLKIAENELPRGSGFDSGTSIDINKSTGEKIILHTNYHHMNENGMYIGWTEHTLTVTPSLYFDFKLNISGLNRNNIKEYINQVFQDDLSKQV